MNKIGNNSEGKLQFTAMHYTRDGSQGLTLFLNSIMITKLEKYSGGVGFTTEDAEDIENGFISDDDETDLIQSESQLTSVPNEAPELL